MDEPFAQSSLVNALGCCAANVPLPSLTDVGIIADIQVTMLGQVAIMAR